ncbi:MAG: response regulator [Elusimicrobia bacterium]|nr:response regulator [Elusimicrobiota bacterium]
MADKTNPALREKVVMIVDDDDSVRELLEYVVKKEGFSVVKAVDGEEALAKIASLPPAVILLDLMLPRYGGYEVLRKLQHGPTADIPIIIITGRYTERTTTEMIRQESNVVEFLEKPIKTNVLASLLHRILKTESSTLEAKPKLPGW